MTRDDNWGLRAYAAAQGNIYAETMAEALSWLRPIIILSLVASAIVFAVLAYFSRANSFQQNLWVELAGSVAMFAGVSVFLCFGLRFGTVFRLVTLGAAVVLSVIAYHSAGVTQQLLLELGAGLVVLICVELWIERLIKRLNSKIEEYENNASDRAGELEDLNPQKPQGL